MGSHPCPCERGVWCVQGYGRRRGQDPTKSQTFATTTMNLGRVHTSTYSEYIGDDRYSERVVERGAQWGTPHTRHAAGGSCPLHESRIVKGMTHMYGGCHAYIRAVYMSTSGGCRADVCMLVSVVCLTRLGVATQASEGVVEVSESCVNGDCHALTHVPW